MDGYPKVATRERKLFLRILLIALCGISFIFPTRVLSEENEISPPLPAVKALTLERATMCEEVVGQNPQNPAVVFSIKRQIIYCFSSFDPVPENTYIFHNWYRGDKLSTKIKLRLRAPRWSTYSRIRLREADRGPWRVEMTDLDGNILKTLRFSVTK